MRREFIGFPRVPPIHLSSLVQGVNQGLRSCLSKNTMYPTAMAAKIARTVAFTAAAPNAFGPVPGLSIGVGVRWQSLSWKLYEVMIVDPNGEPLRSALAPSHMLRTPCHRNGPISVGSTQLSGSLARTPEAHTPSSCPPPSRSL